MTGSPIKEEKGLLPVNQMGHNAGEALATGEAEGHGSCAPRHVMGDGFVDVLRIVRATLPKIGDFVGLGHLAPILAGDGWTDGGRQCYDKHKHKR